MQKDIRDLLEDYKEEKVDLSVNHSSKFEDLLQSELHKKKTKQFNFKWLSVAASIVLLISFAIKFYPTENINTPVNGNVLTNDSDPDGGDIDATQIDTTGDGIPDTVDLVNDYAIRSKIYNVQELEDEFGYFGDLDFSDYEEDRKKRVGEAGLVPKRVRYKKLA